MLTKKDFIKELLAEKKVHMKDAAEEFAPANIALCKYWGKRDTELNLPVSSSISLSLGKYGTKTRIELSETNSDIVIFNNTVFCNENPAAKKIIDFSSLLKPDKNIKLKITTSNNIPTASGTASSASGFAALTKALNSFFGYSLSEKELSITARLGSGSASRSIFNGFAVWHKGSLDDGSDSFAEKLPYTWGELLMGIVTVTNKEKAISSRDGMKRIVETSLLYEVWPKQCERDFELIMRALENKDFELLGTTAENNALAMHGVIMSSNPPILYWEPETVAAIKKVFDLRSSGIQLYFTIDAGANIKLLFEKKNKETVEKHFPNIMTAVPFENQTE